MSRVITRVLLGLAVALALYVIYFAIRSQSDSSSIAQISAVASALAVITAVVAAWGAQRVVELEEDKQKPYPYPSFDFGSRYGLVLFKVENSGGGAAHNIIIDWDKPLKDRDDQTVSFGDSSGAVDIPVLLPSRDISKVLDGHIGFFEGDTEHLYSGRIRFSDSSGRNYSHSFRMNAEVYRGTPQHSEEALRTHYELQKIPSQLQKLEVEIRRVRIAITAKPEDEI